MDKVKRTARVCGLYLIIGMFLIVALFPIYWMIITAFKKPGEIIQIVPTFWPKDFVFANIEKLFMNYPFLMSVKNSLLISLAVSVLSMIFSFFSAYAIARLSFKAKGKVMKGILYSYLMPKAILFIPLYILVSSLGFSNRLSGLLLIYPTFTIPYITWMLISYLKAIPLELEEAAEIDGCTKWQTMWKIVVPLAKPGLFSTFIISITLCWNEYLYAMVMINERSAKTVPLILSEMIVGDVFAWGPLMAGAALASIPILLIYLISSSNMISGLTSGGVKG